MSKYSKSNRHRSHLRGNEFVNSFNGLRYYPTFDTEVNIPGEYAKVDVTLNLDTYPIRELTDVAPLNNLKAKMKKAQNSAPAPMANVPQTPSPESKRKRISPWGWLAIAGASLFTACGVIGCIQSCKASA